MVKIRLTRMGRKKRPFYRIVALDSRRRRDGAYLEKIGHYDPIARPTELVINHEAALRWLGRGAQVSDTVRSLFRRGGVFLRWDMTKRGYDVEKIEAAVTEHNERHNSILAKEKVEKVKVEWVESTPEAEDKPKKKKAKAAAEEAKAEAAPAEKKEEPKQEEAKVEATPENTEANTEAEA